MPGKAFLLLEISLIFCFNVCSNHLFHFFFDKINFVRFSHINSPIKISVYCENPDFNATNFSFQPLGKCRFQIDDLQYPIMDELGI